MGKAHAVRLSDEVSEWVEVYAEKRGVKPSDLLRTAIEDFKVDAEAGVPEIRRTAREQAYAVNTGAVGVGDCPRRPGELGHVWGGGEGNACSFCGALGRADHDPSLPLAEQEGHFARATAARAELFANLRTPQSIKGTTSDEKRA